MERRDFLRTGLAFGAAGAAGLGGVGILPEISVAAPRSESPDGLLRLNFNENPLGLAPAARRALIDGIGEANRYPVDSRQALIEALASTHRVKTENILLGAGSTQVLQIAVAALGTPKSPLVVADPTFEDVPSYSKPFPWRLKTVPLDDRFAHDIGQMHDKAQAWGGRSLVYICNPNNPTGTLTPSAEIDDWIESAPADAFFLVDEAYYEYVNDPAYWSCLKHINDRPNVIVVRTFSKIYGMAGMRLGYAIAHPETIALLRNYKSRNSANHLANVAGRASLEDAGLIARSREANTKGRETVYEVCGELGLEHMPSHTNFLMHRVNGDLDTYRNRMLENNVKVGRPFPPYLEYNRLSIGTPEQMGEFVEILRGFRKKGWV